MISHAASKLGLYEWSLLETTLCFIVFMDLTAFFFLTFMNICFDTLVADPPIWVLTILFAIMSADLGAQIYFNRKITFKFCLHLAIMVTLILSWAINGIPCFLFFSACIFLRFPETIKFNDIMKAIVRPYHGLHVAYTFCKIFYLIAVVGHALGCIFYAIDNTLIKAEYYGSIRQNPSLYYQGQLLCYTPIYALDEINRYVYCMYYILSLLATVAYGDIIPKNPFENAYVCFLLVLSTISISFIIQQLLIVLGQRLRQTFQILKRVKFFNSMLQKSAKISNLRRLTLVGYLMHSIDHQMSNNPNFQRLTYSLQMRLMSESVGLKERKHTFNSQEGMNKIVNFRIYRQYSLPSFLVHNLLLKMELKYYPADYLIIDNQNKDEPSSMYLTLRGELQIGYGKYFFMRKSVKRRNKLIGWRQFIFDNKYMHRFFKAQTKGLSQLYTISSQSLKQLIKNQRQKNQSDHKFSQFLENYYISINNQLLQIFIESNEVDHSHAQLQKIEEQDKQLQQDIQQISTHILRCWCCGKRTHFPIKCPNLHYKPNIHQIIRSLQTKIQTDQVYSRPKIRSFKLKFLKYKSKDNQQLKRNELMRQFLNRKYQQLNRFKMQLQGRKPVSFECYYGYQNFYHSFNIQRNFTGN